MSRRRNNRVNGSTVTVTASGPALPAVRADDSIFPHSSATSDGMRLRITQVKDTTAAISKPDWTKQLAISRQLFGRMGMVAGAIGDIATYAVGAAWVPQFKGEDKAWGKVAADWLFHWFKRCNVRGQPYTFQRSLFIDSVALDRDGDSAMVFVTAPDGSPLLQWLPAHRIDSRWGWSQGATGFGIVPAGRFKGLRIYNGVIYAASGAVVGHNVVGDSGDGSDDRQLGVDSCQLLYEPDWSDQGRGIPRLVSGLLDWMDYEDIAHFLKRQVKQDSAQGILHYNEAGQADEQKDFIEGGASSSGLADIAVEKMEGNEVMYFKAEGGGRLVPYTSGRPSPNVDNYTQRILRACHKGLRWPVELSDPSKIGGASTRLIQDIARRTIQSRQETLFMRAIRAVMFGLSAAMDRGEIPRSAGDWWNWGFTMPPKLTVDARYDIKSAIEKIKFGAGTYSDFYGENGQWWQEEIDQRIAEQKYIQEACAAAGVDQEKVQQMTPNGAPAAPAGTADDSTDEMDTEEDDDGDNPTDKPGTLNPA